MSVTEKYLTYRGDLQAIASIGAGKKSRLQFIAVHKEKRATALYGLSPDTLDLVELPLPSGGVSMAIGGDDTWIGGTDAHLYFVSSKAKSAKDLGELPATATKLAMLGDGARLAAICHKQLVIVELPSGKPLQRIDLPEKGTALAADETGAWLAVGTSKGEVLVFDCEEKEEFRLSESAKLHEGAVTALLFEPEELRFFSAGADQKLLLTHARSKLEPEDRGRGNTHAEPITAMLHVPGERFITGSGDRSCKSWARAGATKPATVSEGIPAVVGLTLIDIHERTHLAIAGDDNTLRLFLLDAGGRISTATHRIYDAYDRASHFLADIDTARRGEALHALAEYDDQRSLELLAKHATAERDPSLRLRATQLLANAEHERAAKLLEPMLNAADGSVRLAALEGLRKHLGNDNLRPLELALATDHADVGTAAINHLQPLAKSNDLARRLLTSALENTVPETRRAALLALESVLPKSSPEASLIAAVSTQADTRRLALIRAYQRKLLADSRVEAAIRRCGADDNAEVRHTAFLVSLMSRAKLAKAVRERDKDLHRQLFELENFQIEPKKEAKSKEPPKLKATKVDLSDDDRKPLFSAMSSQAIDTSLLGARCLALLGDPRSFGLLLQLSLEDQPSARVQVCRALEALADQRAARRLESLINDSAAEVRDAAYSALAKIGKKDPLAVAEAGLGSNHADIRRRGLQTLMSAVRKSKAKGIQSLGRNMLLLALNDSESSVRKEALKSSLNLNIGGDQPETLRFVLSSVHADVRKEVLTEAMAEDRQPWAWELLLELFNDPDAGIRIDAFQHANGKKKGRDVGVLRTALASRYADIRKRATDDLIRLESEEAQLALLIAINDDEPEVRMAALLALRAAKAVEAIRQSIESRHADVRLGAAGARAMYRDPAAGEPLLKAATAEEPENDDDRATWLANAEIALRGLRHLGDPTCIDELLPLLESKHEAIRAGAAQAILWSAGNDRIDDLIPLMQHSDPQVRYPIAMALALLGEPIAGPVLFSDEAAEHLSDSQRLMVATAFGDSAEHRLVGLLDSQAAWIRNAALLVLLWRDWLAHDGTPSRILAALAGRMPRIRLTAARALQLFADPQAYAAYLVQLINDRGEQKPWTITAEQVESLAQMIVFGSAHAKSEVLGTLELLAEAKQDDWDFATSVLFTRFETEFASAAATASKTKLPKLEASGEELTEIAFGAYVGLVREQGSYVTRDQRPGFGATMISIRRSALGRLCEVAAAQPDLLPATRSVLIQALADPMQEVRGTAFEKLLELQVPHEELAEAALESGQNDIAVEGLKLLTEGAGKKGEQILRDTMATRDDKLAFEAAQLLSKSEGVVPAAEAALESPHLGTRLYGMFLLVQGYQNEKGAPAALRKALKSRYEDIRLHAAASLAGLKDKAALPALEELLGSTTEPRDQRKVVKALEELGDPKAIDILFDRMENDPDKSADASTMLLAIANFREPSSAERILPLMERPGPQHHVQRALLIISGYDQRIEDPSDELPHRDWLENQHPRHNDVLAAVMQKAIETRRIEWLNGMIPYARWALSGEADPVLGQLTMHSADKLRHSAMEAVGWRLKHRTGPADPLLAALEHRDPISRFLAAEGLAKGGKGEGTSVLLSAIELMSDLPLRRRAVIALGELGDLRALDILLRIAGDEGHALQDSAAEAIGHLGKSDKSEEILKLLLRLAKSSGSVARRAVIGLRWLDTASGWNLLRELACAEAFSYRTDAIQQLGYNDDPATRDLLLKIIRESWSGTQALLSARRLFGEQSLEPDFAVMASSDTYVPSDYAEEMFGCLRRILEHGEPERIFAVLATARECFERLAFHLTSLDPLPENEAAEALSSPDADTVSVAAQVIGRSGNKSHGKLIAAAISHWQEKWEELDAKPQWVDCCSVATALKRLSWAAGRTATAKSELLTLAGSHVGKVLFAEVRVAALAALAEMKLTKTDLGKIEPLVDDPAAEVRCKAAELLAIHKPAEAAALAGQMVSDRHVFNRLLASEYQPDPTFLNEAAANVHYQPVALPHLIAAGEVTPLVEVAVNQEQGEAARFAAIEGLACMASEEAEQELALIGESDSFEEEIRKAAWRGLKRSKRTRGAA